jgi:hypothetical protein
MLSHLAKKAGLIFNALLAFARIPHSLYFSDSFMVASFIEGLRRV